MAEIKVVIADNQDDPMLTLKDSLKKSGLQVASCASGFDALDEIINSGGDVLVIAEKLPDISGYQLSCLLKSTSITSTLPILLVSSGDHTNESFWQRASLADSVLQRKQVEHNEADSIKLIKRLGEKAAKDSITPDKIDNQPVISGEFGGNDLIKSYHELLNGLLAERLIRYFTRKLTSTINDRSEFTTQYFDLISRLFKPDLAGIIVNSPNTPWSVYHMSKTLAEDIFQTLTYNAHSMLGLTKTVQSSIYGETPDKKGVSLQKAKLLEIPSPDGSKLGMLMVGWTSDKDIDSVLKTSLEHLKDQMSPVLQMVIAEEKYKELQEQAQYWSMVDPITGLYNLEFFLGFLQQQLLFSQRQKLPVGLCIIDVDGFVNLTAKYGSETGNSVLKSLSDKLSSCIRSSDLMARYGGDQFVVVLPNTDSAGAKILAEKLRLETEKLSPEVETGKHPRVTVSIGIAQYSFQDTAPETILKDAKQALMRAKEKGKNCFSE